MKKIIIYLSVLLISNIYAQCDDYSQAQCSNDNSCEWVENIESVGCASLAWNEELCEAAPECTYSCWDADGYFGWCTPECTGGMTYIDNGYCQEIVMSECSEMDEFQCSHNFDCDWIEDIDWGSCEDLTPIWNVIYYCDDPSTNSDNCYTYTCYGGSYGQWGTCCGGDPYLINDNSYCQESEETFDQCSDLETMPYCNHSSLYDLDCMWVDGQCIDYEEPQLECSEMEQQECESDGSCDWNEDIDYASCSDLTASECNEYFDYGCLLDQDCLQWGSWYSWICYSYGPSYCTGGSYQLDNSYCEEIVYLLGDYNSDGLVNVIDVTQVIGLILNGDSYDIRVDMNSDGIINISDIIVIVNIILNT